MLPGVTFSSRVLPAGIAALLVLSACGGGDDARDVLSGGDTAGDTMPDTTPDTVAEAEPTTVVTDPATTIADAAPDTTADTVAPSDEADGSDPSGDLAAFCGASSQFYVEARSLGVIGPDDDAAARTLFGRMELSLAAALLNAPDEATAAAPRRVDELFAILLPALDTLGYDFAELETLDNSEEVAAAFTEFSGIVDDLAAFLTDTCEMDAAELAARADALGLELGSTSTSGSEVPTTVGEDELAVTTVVDDSGRLTAEVPVEWTDSQGTPDEELRQLVASADIAAFLASFAEPGMILVSGDTPDLNGAEAATAAIAGFEGAITSQGCVLENTETYDDGLYSGEERRYSCPDTTAVTRLAGGTNETADLFWLLAVVHEVGDEASWTTVTESFLVD